MIQDFNPNAAVKYRLTFGHIRRFCNLELIWNLGFGYWNLILASCHRRKNTQNIPLL